MLKKEPRMNADVLFLGRYTRVYTYEQLNLCLQLSKWHRSQSIFTPREINEKYLRLSNKDDR